MESQQPTVGIASFIQKLDLMLRDESTKDTVYWGPFNDTVIIKNNDYFTNFVLPNYFRHNQMSSFIRQMNKHGFHRIKSDRLVDRKENDIYEYKNEYFQRGNRDRWSSICCGNALPKPGPIHEINVKQKLQELSDDNERLKSQSNMSRDKCAQLERSVRLCHEKIAKQTALINRITELISAKDLHSTSSDSATTLDNTRSQGYPEKRYYSSNSTDTLKPWHYAPYRIPSPLQSGASDPVSRTKKSGKFAISSLINE